jgi:multidrug efflux pump subunit AcrB
MSKIIGWWANNPVAANLLMVGILLSGFLGFTAMEREAFPSFKDNSVRIQVVWPGAAPQEVEEQILFRIEGALKNIDTISRVYSTAQEGFAQLEVSSYANVDVETFINEIKNAVDSVNGLPRDIEKPSVIRQIYRQEMIRVAVHGDLDERTLNRLAETLRDEIGALPFISIVELFGVRREEVSIELSEESMRRYGTSFSEVATAIRNSSVNLSSGRIRTETGDVLLRARNLASSESDFEAIVIRQNSDGGMVTVGDVARVVDGYEDEEILATVNGEPSVLLQIMSTDNMQVVKSSDSVRAWMEKRQETMPTGVSLMLWNDTADIYKSRMATISSAAFAGLILVFLVLILSLRPQVALWVTVGISVAFMGTFALLPTFDVSLNILSTFAFLLVLGIVVDDAIVVGESIHNQTSIMGGGPEGAVEGALLVSKPVFLSVLTTIIAFAPWFFISGPDAQITRQLSIVITLALIISLLEAFLILPSHLRKLRHRENLGRLASLQKRIEKSIIGFANLTYRGLVKTAIAHRYITVAVFISAFIISLGFFSSGWVKFSFSPEVESEEIYINVELPEGTPYARALEVLDQLQLAERELITQVENEAQAKGDSGDLVEGWYTRSRRDSVIAIVKLAPPESRYLSAKQTAIRLRDLVGDIPDALNIKVNYTLNDQGPQISYLLRHRDMNVLRQASKELQMHLYSYDGTVFVRDNLRGETDELHIELLPGAEKLGVTLTQVSQQIRQAYYGEQVQRLPRENGDVKVMVKYPKDQRRNLESLNNFMVRATDGREFPLLSVVDIELASGVQRIQRRDGERMVRVSAQVEDDLTNDIDRDVTDNFLEDFEKRHPGLAVGKSGRQETEEEFFSEIGALYLIAFFIMYALIAIGFRSYFLPILIVIAIPFAFMGAIYGHLLFGVSMSIFSYFGIGAAAGVVVNDNLVLVDYIIKLRDKGKSAVEAVVESAVSRFRPILLTSVTTFIGLMPIMAERSTSAQFLKPAVLALAFGVLFALFVTLLMVPSLYCVGEDLKLVGQKIKKKLRNLV